MALKEKELGIDWGLGALKTPSWFMLLLNFAC